MTRWIRVLPGLVLLAAGCRNSDQIRAPGFTVQVVSGSGQEAAVGTAVPAPVVFRVADEDGNPIAGATVEFSVVSGDGSVVGDSVITATDGTASPQSWILGTMPGTNTLKATEVPSQASATVNATAITGDVAGIHATQTHFVALVGTAVGPAPTVVVLDDFGNPVAGVTVQFSVTAGGGSVAGATVVTDSSGSASVGSWTLGPAPGTNLLSAVLPGGATVVFTAQALATAPVATAISPQTQAGYLNFPVTAVPRVRVTDDAGNPLTGATVTFATSGGDATLTGGTAVTDSTGVAAPSDWRLGAAASSTVVATVALATTPVTFTATGTPAPFLIDLRFLTPMTPDIRDAFVTAARRWMGIITAHVGSVNVNLPAGACAPEQPALNEMVTDLVIFAEVEPIDGVGNILGSASPCAERSASDLPVVGEMQFDSADLQALLDAGQLTLVITHEMAHVLGFGTIWSSLNLLDGAGGSDPVFTGAATLALWPPFGTALGYAGRPVPVENTGGTGTRDDHWRESVFNTELMTGFIEAPGVAMPLSRVTIGSMADLGYQVDYSKADPFAGNLLARSGAIAAPKVLGELIGQPRWRIAPDGTVTPIH